MFKRGKANSMDMSSADPEGGTGGPDPPSGKSQVIWVSIGNKQLDPSGKSWTPLENVRPLWKEP